MNAVLNHLWQSSLVALVLSGAAMLLRNQPARIRFWLYFAALLKFFLPFEWLMWRMASAPVEKFTTPITTAVVTEQLTTTFAPIPRVEVTHDHWMLTIWIVGGALLALHWLLGVWRMARIADRAETLRHIGRIRLLRTNAKIEPGVWGIFKPVVLLPHGLEQRLTSEQYRAVLRHEFAHIRRSDNLLALPQLLVQLAFWFHPLVWWLGAKTLEERERACDEAVVSQPEVYAEGILNVCRYYLESPTPLTAGVTGAGLKQRIREILTPRLLSPLNTMHRLALATAGAMLLLWPVAIGYLRAQTLPPEPQYRFEEAVIRKGDPSARGVRIGPGPQRGIRTQNTTVIDLIRFAFEVQSYQIVGGPKWVQDERFDITASADSEPIQPSPDMPRSKMEEMFSRQRQRMQALLRDRFGLVLRADEREMPIFALVVSKRGIKFKPTDGNPKDGRGLSVNPGRLQTRGMTLSDLARGLAGVTGKPVVDQTGLAGEFDITIEFAPDDSPDAGKGSIFTAIEEQAGLRLESKRGKAPVFVIEKLEKPTEN
jgi:bla regulator protein blaR1